MRSVFAIFARTNRFLYATIGFRPVTVPIGAFFLFHPGFGRFKAFSGAFAGWAVQVIARAANVS